MYEYLYLLSILFNVYADFPRYTVRDSTAFPGGNLLSTEFHAYIGSLKDKQILFNKMDEFLKFDIL